MREDPIVIIDDKKNSSGVPNVHTKRWMQSGCVVDKGCNTLDGARNRLNEQVAKEYEKRIQKGTTRRKTVLEWLQSRRREKPNEGEEKQRETRNQRERRCNRPRAKKNGKKQT